MENMTAARSSSARQLAPATGAAGNGFDHSRLQNDLTGFSALSEILKGRCGIDLPPTPKNLSLMASRMRKLLLARGLESYGEYARMIHNQVPGVMNEFISALTTNTTHFFRENEHFNHLRKILPELIEAKRREGSNELRVWCAASSTGQEPYTILISLLESGVLPPGMTLKFLATDIDLQVLEKASNAIYREEDIENMPPVLVSRYFEKGIGGDGQRMVRVLPRYASMIRFARLNLIEPRWPFQNKFDIIFCRNVLIYFDSPTAQGVVERLAGQLNPGGYLYVGHSESGHVKTRLVKSVVAAAYVRLPGPALSGGNGK
jgi:chemotaxis protein methyltransferase CheR